MKTKTPAFANSSGLKSVFEKSCFCGGLVYTEGLQGLAAFSNCSRLVWTEPLSLLFIKVPGTKFICFQCTIIHQWLGLTLKQKIHEVGVALSNALAFVINITSGVVFTNTQLGISMPRIQVTWLRSWPALTVVLKSKHCVSPLRSSVGTTTSQAVK